MTVLIALIENNTRMASATPAILRTGRQTQLLAAVFYIVSGALFIAWGLFGEPRMHFIAILGGVFIVYGLFTMVRAFSMTSLASTEKERTD